MNWRCLSIIFIALLLFGCKKPEALEPAPHAVDSAGPLTLSKEQEAKIGFSTTAVSSKSMPLLVEATGTVKGNPNLTTPVISLVPGRVEAVFVKHGDDVKKGQILARIRSDEVGQIETDLLTKILEADAERKQAQLKINLAQKIYDRKRFLLDAKIAARADVEQAETDLDQAKAQLAAVDLKEQMHIFTAKERLRLYGIEPNIVEQVIKDKHMEVVFEVIAPRDGIIAERDCDTGELVEAAKQLFSVSDLTRIWLVANVLENNLKYIKKGLPVTVSVDSYPGESFSGKIDYIDSHLSADTRTLAVHASIDNRLGKLKPEMFARMSIEVGKTSCLMVPQEAVQRTGESSLVYLVGPDNTFVEKKVTTGRTIGSYIEILSGLTDHDTVVVNGSLQLLGLALQRLSQ
ncbi:MAG: efflux RND transporter periplasmic adaptor subunit [Candidatus Obscuribacterales bacterium]|nr:efflux RND transporter periplasmic adaptor subunit [Candidatus Obscuribacterales bacterium]